MQEQEKKDRYEKVIGTIESMIEGEADLLATLSTISCEL